MKKQNQTFINPKEFKCSTCGISLNYVCMSSIISVHEDGYSFECLGCFLKQQNMDEVKKGYALRELREIIISGLRR